MNDKSSNIEVAAFIERWESSGAAERANCQIFLSELCSLLGVDPPDPATPDISQNKYVFERAVTFQHGDGSASAGRIDLYKRGCFVLEAKQGVEDTETKDELLSDAARELKCKLRKGIGKRGGHTWDDAMQRARGQAERYTRALSAEEARPPFIVVVDVGHSIELFSEFSCTGGSYVPFPAAGSHRIFMKDLECEDVRLRLRALWNDPASLDPTRRSARVTREIAAKLAKLARSLEATSCRPRREGTPSPEIRREGTPSPEIWREGTPAPETLSKTQNMEPGCPHPESLEPGCPHPEDSRKRIYDPQTVAGFLMRCLFTMFAEDVGLIIKNGFTHLIESLRDTPEHFVPMVEELWDRMNRGGFSTSLRTNILQFNGGLFKDATALPLSRDQLLLLIEAAKCDWCDVEPAIFGTLLERALDPIERHKLGAHYTPRSYVERLVLPTIVNPIRAEWNYVRTAATLMANNGDIKKAASEINKFHRKLVNIRVLDPACGSGNFLYVTLEHLKRIEGEVFDTLDSLGERQIVLEMSGETVDPHQLLGLEINPRAAAIAELVLWIGTLQWHFRNRGSVNPPQPIIRNFKNIECRDALIEFDDKQPVLDDEGRPVTHWDGRTTKTHPVTGKEVPDETAQVPVYNYINARKAEWPEADYIIGNPPFIGTAMMRQALGDGYTETVRKIHSDLGESSDFVMYWWNHAAELVREGKIKRFGFITTNSLRQKFNRRVLAKHLSAKKPLSITFAIQDHPWVDSAAGAAVRIAMTSAEAGQHEGVLQQVAAEVSGDGEGYEVELVSMTGKIQADLTVGANVAGAVPLRANSELSCPGVKLHGSGFIVTPEEAESLGIGTIPGLEKHIRGYRNGRDLTAKPRGVMVIDLFGLTADEVLAKYPAVYQRVVERVKPERDQNKRKSYRENWWIHGEPRKSFRPALKGLPRYIATVETSKHRFFTFLDASILPDNRLINIALDDACFMGILGSRIHICWSLATGGILGPTPVYAKTTCFEAFPFPATTLEQKRQIRELAEQLDTHRKRQQEQHPGLTMTGMYNVLEKLRAGEALTAKDKKTHEDGLVTILKQIHDELDAAVAEAYGWNANISDEEILEKLVALNTERSAEEAQGKIRWLRPEFQNPGGESAEQGELAVRDESERPTSFFAKATEDRSNGKNSISSVQLGWPKTLPEQVGAVRKVLGQATEPLTPQMVARKFRGARKDKIEPILETIVSFGQVWKTEGGMYVGSN